MRDYQSIIDHIRSIYKEPKGFIPLHAPMFIGNEKKYLEECIDSTFVSSVGKFVDEFEIKIAEYTNSPKAVVCVNGTNAIQIALQLLGVESGDEVITQSLTFIATANAISYVGAKPIFVDVDKETMGMSPDSLVSFLEENTFIENNECINKTTGKRIKACLPMHTFGHPCRIDKIIDICNQNHIEVVEDAAESLGSTYKNKHTGTFAKIGALSFNGNKILTTGGGGILLFQDKELARIAKHLTTQAKVPHRWEFVHDSVGYNFRMPNINAALGCAQLENLSKFIESKRNITNKYRSFFIDIENVTFFTEPKYSKSNYWLNALIFEDRRHRDEFLEFSNSNNVMTRPIWELMNRLPMFKDCQCTSLTNSEWLADRVVNIPSSVI